ncbi:MAG: bifunctional glutamate N-acetyltransferase/amino-acid acetyltransferase ArgJ [Syntrophobacterales bacterium]|nr:bifunctional glutamate N-acetyltransferase/amino-acid acetyltransferase ArgJ [Syntrophobacterales bacterium]
MKKVQECKVPGFLANGIPVGIKENGERDLSLIFSRQPATTSAVFTTNCFKAAPVQVDMERIRSGKIQAIVINSGVANAATGKEGIADALAVSRALAAELAIDEERIFVASTGVIGRRLPLGKIVGGIKDLVAGLNENGIADAEAGIMTTDRFPKIAFRRGAIGGCEISLCGIAKGAGMIQPNMATMLAFVMTDVAIEKEALDALFHRAAAGTFNAVTVDGCMSTNDTAVIMANGVAGNRPVKKGSRSAALFGEMLADLMLELAKSLVRDGEGATKMIEINVTEALTQKDAEKVAYAIANSNLVKTAFFGEDPNWGRIISAAGAVGVDLPVLQVKLFIEDVPLFAEGKGVSGREDEIAKIMKRPEIKIGISLGMGKKSWRVCTSDLSFDYVKINAHYHT